MKKALITGIAGQDGSYLAELLLKKGYEVHGLIAELPDGNNSRSFFRIQNILSQISLHRGNVTDTSCIKDVVRLLIPDEIYDLAAIVDPLVSLDTEKKILSNNLEGIHNILGAVKEFSPNSKVFFASSSLIFGNPTVSPQDENTPKEPSTPYGIAKTAGSSLVNMYRDSHGVFACSGILYNHESPRRDSKFLPKKIVEAAVRIASGAEKELRLGNLDAVRDWGYAGDFVEAMWLMLQQGKAEDYVIGTGIAHTVKDILSIAFGHVNLKWEDYVVVDDKFVRAKEDNPLIANSQKAKNQLGWVARTKFNELIRKMVEHELKESKK